MQINHQYIETLVVTILAALIGLSMPMIMQIVQRLDTKYSSTLIANRFRDEWWYKCYRFMVWTSIFCVLCLPFTQKSPVDCWFLNNSAHVLAWICLSSTLWSLFKVSGLIVKYETPNKLIDRIAKKSEDIYNDAIKFNIFFDFMKFSMIAEDNNLYLKCNRIFGECIGLFRKNKEGQEIIYPNHIYKAVSESLLVCQKNYDRMLLPSLNSPYLPITVYFDETGETFMSQATYMNLWKNLIQLASSNKEDWIKGYWVYANQYVSYTLEDKRHKSDIETYEKHFRQYVQLHHVFLAYLLNQERYDLVKWTFGFSNSSLQQYLLTAKDFNSIVEYGADLLDLFGVIIIETRYTFYQEEGVRTGSYIQSWIMRYYLYSLLFQYERLQKRELVSSPLNFQTTFENIEDWKRLLDIVECLRNFLYNEQEYFKSLEIREDTIKEVDEYLKQVISKIDGKIKEKVSQIAVNKDEIKRGEELLKYGITSNLKNFYCHEENEQDGKDHEADCPDEDNFKVKVSLTTSKYNYSLAKTSFLNNMIPSLCFGIMRKVSEKYVRTIMSISPKTRFKIDFDEVDEALDILQVDETNKSVLPIAHTFSSKKYKSLTPLSGSESCLLILNKDSLPQIKFLNNAYIDFNTEEDDMFIEAEAEFLFQNPTNINYIRLDIINSLYDGKTSDLELLRRNGTQKNT